MIWSCPASRCSASRKSPRRSSYRHVVYSEWGFAQRIASGKGLKVLFAGASGTGKTMTAGVIARDLGLDLYKIDLSGIVSKYIGETEKNLDRIFRAAHASNAILFFDEADALFGKRSEVKDAHDRYANIEVAYLLQKIEEHEGVVILASNLSKNIDDAFSRRMHYVIEFPLPDERHRELLWRGMFPPEVPLGDRCRCALPRQAVLACRRRHQECGVGCGLSRGPGWAGHHHETACPGAGTADDEAGQDSFGNGLQAVSCADCTGR